MQLCLNSLIAWHSQDEQPKIERVLYINPRANLVYTIDIHSPTALPIAHSYADIEASLHNLDASIVVEVQDPLRLRPIPPPSDTSSRQYQNWEQRSKASLKHRDKSWALIEPLIQSDSIFDSDIRGAMIRGRSQETRASRTTIYDYLRRYWQGGMTKGALMPLYANSGGKGKQRKPGTKKRGRPNSLAIATGTSVGINVDGQIQVLFEAGLQKYYNTPLKLSLKQAFDKITSQYFIRVNSRQENGKVELLDPSQRPTFDQFRYWYETYGDPAKASSRRERALAHRRQWNAPLEDVSANTFGPGSCFEVDSTIADVYLVSSFNSRWIVGRPVIYVVKDVFSRMIVGFAILLEGPSWLGAMLAIENATTDKVAFCAEYGIAIDEGEWPCCYLPAKIRADRGEFEGYNADNLAEGLNIEIENTAPFLAEWKAIVERDFGLCNKTLIHFLPGAVRRRERGDKDYRLDARLTLREMRQLMIKRIIQYNNYHRLEEYEFDRDMIEARVEPYPIDLWNWGIRNRVGALCTLPRDTIRQNLLYRSEASVTRRGIGFQGLRYTCATANKEYWFVTAKRKKGWKVTVFFDPRCLDTIFIRHENGQMEACVLLDRKRAFKRRDWYELLDYEALRRQSRYKRRSRDEQAKADFDQDIEQIKKKAEDRYKATVEGQAVESARKRTADIRDNRRREKEYERQNSLWITPEQPTPGARNSDMTSLPSTDSERKNIPRNSFNESSADYDFLRSIREELRGSGGDAPKEPHDA